MNKIKLSKKGVELPLNTVVIAAILLIVLFVIIYSFTNLFGKETDKIGAQIDNLGDEDDDGIINMFDKCPCRVGEQDYKGCPTEADIPKDKKEKEAEEQHCKK